MVAVAATIFSCSEDEVKRKGDPDVAHSGDKWNITSVSSYTLTDVSTSGVTSKSGDLTNAGAFYFVEGQNKGSFEMDVAGYNKEDLFEFNKDTDGKITIVSVQQSVGSTTNQNVIVISGNQTSDTEMTLDAVSIIKESSATGVFTFVATSITLVKN